MVVAVREQREQHGEARTANRNACSRAAHLIHCLQLLSSAELHSLLTDVHAWGCRMAGVGRTHLGAMLAMPCCTAAADTLWAASALEDLQTAENSGSASCWVGY